ncbi:hypothetical protein [Rhizobium leguminosarum]|uniref:hypothetical protein n=1 Tax=Rhizobium leguminosarum TaxID=384 RepID=UPI0013B811CD|nr:hypothetical protein [Rhizobium leguminosarum]MBY5385217.1 hypothetical protein [Rhizobium leguminosarum]NEH73975.1 hypothetical protein [Rhizobium leguminosarum]
MNMNVRQASRKDGSMALWCRSVGNQPTASLEAHFNLWRIAGDREFKGKGGRVVRDFLEIGVMLSNPLSVDQINIFLPTAVTLEDIEDCSARLADPSVAQGIFNEPLECTKVLRPARVDLKTPEGMFCRVHEFMRDDRAIDSSQLGIAHESGGTVLSIMRSAVESVCSNSKDGERAYFRLRVFLSPSNSHFIRVISPGDKSFQSGSDEIEYIDFRFNELRTLPVPVEQRMNADEGSVKVPVTLIAFLTAFPINSDLAASSITWHKNRLLEAMPWSDYVDSGVPDGMVVYHWRRKAEPGKPLLDFSSFVKLQTRRTGRRTVTVYLLVAFLFGLAGNVVASGLTSFVAYLYQ